MSLDGAAANARFVWLTKTNEVVSVRMRSILTRLFFFDICLSSFWLTISYGWRHILYDFVVCITISYTLLANKSWEFVLVTCFFTMHLVVVPRETSALIPLRAESTRYI